MRCEELREWISAELDGEAHPEERHAVQQHLAVCVGCQRARAVTVGLRERLVHVSPIGADPRERDEPLFTMLRRDGVIRDQTGSMSLQQKLQHRWTRILTDLASQLGPTLRPALATLAVSFLLTWGSLQWAGASRAGPMDRAVRPTAAVPAKMPRADVLEQWLDGPPTLAALVHLQTASAPVPALPRSQQRGELVRPRRRLG
jgi:hypothetical protein